MSAIREKSCNKDVKRPYISSLAGLVLFLLSISVSIVPVQAADLMPGDGDSTCWDGSTDGSGKSMAGKPVNLFTGSETMRRTDLSLGSLYPISIQRMYNSTSTYDSPLGYGWAMNYDKRLYTYPDGSATVRKDCGQKLRFTWSAVGFIPPAGDSGTLAQNANGTYTYSSKDGSKENYDVYGRIEKLMDSKGNSLTFTYIANYRSALTGLSLFNLDQMNPLIVSYDYRLSRIEERGSDGSLTGAWVALAYDTFTGRLNSIIDSTGLAERTVSYAHDTFGNLTGVNGPSGSAVYAYNASSNRHSLTTINEGQGEYRNAYDTHGRVTKQIHGTGVIDIEYIVPNQKVRVTSTVNDPDGAFLNTQLRMVEFSSTGMVVKNTDTYGNETHYIRDSQTSKIAREEYWENTGTISAPTTTLSAATNYTYDSKGNMLTKTEAQGTSLEKTTTYAYHPVFNDVLTETVLSVVNPAQDRVITNVYDETNGNLLTTTTTGLLGNETPYSYTTTYAYYPNGKLQSIDGPRTDVQDLTSYTYTTDGYLQSTTQPLVGTTTYSNYDVLGNPQTVTDPNGNSTTYTYDTNGRVSTVKAPGDANATQYFYVSGGCSSCGGANKIDHITMPEGNTINYHYDDGLGNLTSISDSLGNSINYTYDSEGNRLTEEIRDAGNSLQKSLSYQYDALSRLKRTTNPDAGYTEYSYDSRGNRLSLRTPNSTLTTYTYDALNRLVATIQPGTTTTGYGYNSNNNLTTVTDANNTITTYKYDDKGRVYQTISPDTNTTTYGYDPAGNMISKIDAKGVAISYVYDAANRLTNINFPTDTGIVYTYDACLNGKGRLCGMTDVSGATVYAYSAKGQTTTETKTVGGVQYVTQYSYDQNGNMKTITYPSGRVITYNYSNDRAISVLNGAANLATNITYKPFGGMSSITYGNGLAGAISYDNQYRVTGITAGTVMNLSYPTYDANGNIKTINNVLDATKNKSFTYDALDQLSTANGSWGALSWTYDGVGNRQAEGATVYSYTLGTDKLSGVGGSTYILDNDGNTTNDGTRGYTYNQNQRLTQAVNGATTALYTYNGIGQRVKKVIGSTTTVYNYNHDGLLIAESDGTGATTAEYVYLGSLPLVKIAGASVYYYHSDHIATPQKMTDASGTVVWSADYKPFGEATVNPSSTITNNLRFPGQYYDAETGLNYNYFRDYNPVIGRYIQADPIGRKGGPNIYNYAWANPVSLFDTKGLDANTFAYGEIRSWAITGITDFTAPSGLGDAKASIGAACSRGNSCASVDGSNATAPGDRAAWSNIVNASGSDQSGGGNFMCVGSANCWFVHSCYRCCGRNRVLGDRGTALSPSGTATVAGKGTLYFYNDSLRGWCSQADYASGCQGS